MVKYLVFDFNGTLVDDLPLIMEIMTSLLRSKNIDLSKYSIDYLRQTGVRNFMKEVKISKLQLLFLYRDIKRLVRSRQNERSLVSGLTKILPELSKKYQLLVFSSGHVEVIKDYLTKNKVNQYFSEIYEDNSYFGKDVGLKKIVKKLKARPQEIAYIGDESRDIVAANKAGAKSIAVTWGFEGDVPLSQANPSYIISEPSKLLNLKL